MAIIGIKRGTTTASFLLTSFFVIRAYRFSVVNFYDVFADYFQSWLVLIDKNVSPNIFINGGYTLTRLIPIKFFR